VEWAERSVLLRVPTITQQSRWYRNNSETLKTLFQSKHVISTLIYKFFHLENFMSPRFLGTIFLAAMIIGFL
jgi:cellulose synthase/poly-beta-1,6-N-acetylglucosamine synthase-like glycosyltransferase